MIRLIRMIRHLSYLIRGLVYSLILQRQLLNWRIGSLVTFRGKPSNFSIGSGFKCNELGRFECFGEDARLEIGEKVKFGVNVHIGVTSKVKIGNNVLLGSNILIIDHNHGYFNDENNKISIPSERPLVNKGPIEIEENVWICDNVAILGGSKIKRGSIVPYGSIVKAVFEN